MIQSTNLPTNLHAINRSIKKTINLAIEQLINQSVNQSVSQSTNQSILYVEKGGEIIYWNQMVGLSVDLNCWSDLLRATVEILLRSAVEMICSGSDCKIICWDQLLRLSVEFICWDQLLRFSVQLLFRNSQALRETGSNCAICNRQKVGMGFLRKAKNLCICWVYLLRSLVKILCSTVEIVYLDQLLRLCADISSVEMSFLDLEILKC